MLKWLWVSGLVIVLDQVTKLFAETKLVFHQPLEVMPFFNLMLVYNTGAAFSFLSEAGGWQRWFFIGVGLIASIIIFMWLRKLKVGETKTALALTLVLGGAIGNIIDRVVYGHVIDFIDWYYQNWHWPAFNIADSAISVGVTLLIIESLFARPTDSA